MKYKKAKKKPSSDIFKGPFEGFVGLWEHLAHKTSIGILKSWKVCFIGDNKILQIQWKTKDLTFVSRNKNCVTNISNKKTLN